MLQHLNEEQIKALDTTRDEWINIGLATGPSDKQEIEDAIALSYKLAGLEPPKRYVHCTDLLDADRQIKEDSNNEYTVFSSLFWGQWDAGRLAYIDYFRKNTDLEHLDDIEGITQLAKLSGPVAMFDEVAYITPRPAEIKLDDEGRLHCEDGPAISFSADLEIYAWHGNRVPAKWIMEEPDMEDALKHENIEMRAVAAEIIGWYKVLEHFKYMTIDENDNKQIGHLIEADIPDVGKERFLIVECGTGRTFAIRVPFVDDQDNPINTASAANAWTYNIDEKVLLSLEVRT